MKLEPLEPEERIMGGPTIIEQINVLVQKLNWEIDDDIAVEVGGASVYEIDGAGTKWVPLKSTHVYNKDAFIVIKNKSRNLTISSAPNPDLKSRHLNSEKELIDEIKNSDEEKNYDTDSK